MTAAPSPHYAQTFRNAQPWEGQAIIRALVGDSQRVLDLGCGQCHYTKHLPAAVKIDLDPIHADAPGVLIMDVKEAPFALRRMRFELGLLTDVLEHLPRPDGEALLAGLPSICRDLAVFSPIGPLNLSETQSPHNHRSAWYPADFEFWNVWEWPRYHRFEDNAECGAFFAWTSNIDLLALSALAKVSL